MENLFFWYLDMIKVEFGRNVTIMNDVWIFCSRDYILIHCLWH